MEIKLVTTFLLLILLTACGPVVVEEEYSKTSPKPPGQFLVTEDNINISYDFQNKGSKAVLLLHMLNSDKSSYKQLAALLASKGYSTLAIDFRGHGDSSLDVASFEDSDFLDFEKDIEAAALMLNKQNKELFAIVGASIGANIALQYGIKKDIPKLILLSPGLNYRGITTAEAAKNIKREVFTLVSHEDTYSLESSKALHDIMAGRSRLEVASNAGHGTEIISNKPEIQHTIANFIEGKK